MRFSLKRGWAIAITIVLFVAVLMALLGVFAPLLFTRLVDFGQALPEWIDASAARLQDLASAGTQIGVDLDVNGIINGVALGMKRQLQAFLLGIPDFLAGSLGGFLSVFFLVVLTVFF